MCSWGSNQKIEKFYKGAQSDTPWNKDLLWRYHVSKETKQAKVNAGELPPPESPVHVRHPRMKMGITGTLIPDITPRYHDPTAPERAMLRSASGRLVVGSALPLPQPTHRSRSRSSAASTASYASSSVSKSSSSSSLRSIRLQDVQELLEQQSKLLKEKTDDEIQQMRTALIEEARRREAAEQKIHYLCEKLGLQEHKT